MSYFLTVCAIALLAALIAIIPALNNKLNRIPGPLAARFTTLPLKLAVVSGQRVHYVHSLHKRYGSLVRIGPNELAVADVEAHGRIHGGNFDKAHWYTTISDPARPAVFSMLERNPHAVRRRLLVRAFGKKHLVQNWEPVVKYKAKLAVSRIHDEAEKGTADILKWFAFMASDISTKLMFGEDFQTLEQGEVSQYIRILQAKLMGSGIAAELPLVGFIGRRLPFDACRDLWPASDVLRKYGMLAVTNAKRDTQGINIFAKVVEEAEKNEELDDEDIRAEAQNLIVAGTDTTSITLTYLVWAVLTKPELQQKIVAEVESLPPDFVSADVEKLELINAVIEETLRLYGAAPGALPRVVPPTGMVIKDYAIPAGTIVSTQAFTFHRNEDFFPHPEEFLPERWLKHTEMDDIHVSHAASAVYSPFGTGARNCLGIHLAYMELRLAAAEFFRVCPNARLAASTTPESMRLVNHFMIMPAAHKCEVELTPS